MKLRLCFAALLLPALFAAVPAQSLDQAKLDQFLDRLAAKDKAMGTLAFVREGQVIYSRGIGYRQIDGAAKQPATAATRYRIASISKMFTATMILQLVEEGKLKLTDTLEPFFPQVPNAKKITLQQLLQHRSGVPNVRRAPEPQGGAKISTLPITKEEILALVVAASPEFEPDTQVRYSNSGYFLLGLILERVSGKSYADALAERINAKLGLADTYVATGNIDPAKNEALTYYQLGGEWRPATETHPSILFGAGQIVSTPLELAKFIQGLFDGKLVSPATLTAMKTLRDGWGLGMEPFTYAGRTFYGHAGGGDNYGSWLAYQPEEKLVVAYCTNAKVLPVPGIVRDVVDIYYRQPFELPTFEAFAVSAETLEKYTGVYGMADVPGKFTVTSNGATLSVQPPGTQAPMAIEAFAPGKFRLEGVGAEFHFDLEKGTVLVKRRNGERIFTKEK